jgi:hypothetical protein
MPHSREIVKCKKEKYIVYHQIYFMYYPLTDPTAIRALCEAGKVA